MHLSLVAVHTSSFVALRRRASAQCILQHRVVQRREVVPGKILMQACVFSCWVEPRKAGFMGLIHEVHGSRGGVWPWIRGYGRTRSRRASVYWESRLARGIPSQRSSNHVAGIARADSFRWRLFLLVLCTGLLLRRQCHPTQTPPSGDKPDGCLGLRSTAHRLRETNAACHLHRAALALAALWCISPLLGLVDIAARCGRAQPRLRGERAECLGPTKPAY